MSKKEDAEKNLIKPDRQELSEKELFIKYFEITSFLFQEQEGSSVLLEEAIKHNRGFVQALIYISGESRPTIDIIRQHAIYDNGEWRTIDTVTVQSDEKSEFIIKGIGKWTESPKLSPDPKRNKGKQEYQNLNSLFQAFNKASRVKDSEISIFHRTEFVSDGTKWAPVPRHHL